jgi:uncharacterized protein
MKLENEFTVPAPLEQAWSVLLDVERVAPCLPGAVLEGAEGDAYRGTMKIKIGPITSSYSGTVKIEEADEAARRAVMRAQARDSRGQGTAAATITSTMEEVEGGTRVHVETDMRVTGPAAQFGRGVMQDVSAKMMRQFADCLASEMSGPVETASAGGEAGARAEALGGGGGEASAVGGAALGGGSTSGAAAGGGGSPTPDPATADVGASPASAEPTGGAGVTSGTGSVASEQVGGPDGAPAGGGPAQAQPPRPRPTPEVLDLADASREAVLKRAVPLVGGVLVLLFLIRLIRR